MTASFHDYLALLRDLLERRQPIVESIEHRVLNVRGKPLARIRAREAFEAALNGCFFGSAESMRLQRMLAAAHVGDGFEPLNREDCSQRLDPPDLIIRAYEHWDAHRWPGASGRLAFAHTLYAAFMVRQLECLSLRIWDDAHDDAAHRLADAQRVLDEINTGAVTPPFVRDVRWLIHTAQGPLTREPGPYFKVADRIAAAFDRETALAIHAAGAKLAGGHLRSQLRYRASELARSADDPYVLATTRNSNSMDVALLVRDLVPLLEAYRTCGAEQDRIALADAVLQGVSADPELLIVRLDLLTPLTMIEELFIEPHSSGPRYTASGARHLAALARYAELLAEAGPSLCSDVGRIERSGAYSPFGIAYGFCADLFSNAAMDALVHRPAGAVPLEDLFDSRDGGDEKIAQARRWAQLPKRAGERDHFEHSPEWAAAVVERVTGALEARIGHPARPNASPTRNARLFVNSAGPSQHAVNAQEHCLTSDLGCAATTGATAFPKSQILSDRKEARFLASAERAGKWFAVSKVLLTLCTAQGADACVTDVPAATRDVLRLTCPGLLG